MVLRAVLQVIASDVGRDLHNPSYQMAIRIVAICAAFFFIRGVWYVAAMDPKVSPQPLAPQRILRQRIVTGKVRTRRRRNRYIRHRSTSSGDVSFGDLDTTLEYAIKFLEGDHAKSSQISGATRSSILSKVKDVLQWKKRLRTESQISENGCRTQQYDDGYSCTTLMNQQPSSQRFSKYKQFQTSSIRVVRVKTHRHNPKERKKEAKQSKAKRSKAKQSKAKRSQAKQSRAKRSKAKQSKIKQSNAKQSKAKQSKEK